MAIYLTVLEIKHLAESAGLNVDSSGLDDEEMEGEHSIMECPKKGVAAENGTVEHYDYVTTCDGCEFNEVTPLGNPLPS